MSPNKTVFVFVQLLFSICVCELSIEKKDKLLNGFIHYYNNLPNQLYACEEGVIQNVQQIDPYSYDIEVGLRVVGLHNLDTVKFLKCTCKVQDQDGDITVLNNEHQCEEDKKKNVEATSVVEPEFQRKPVQLDNNVQPNNAMSSGEQFIAVPRENPKVHCIGCSSHVNPEAPGVRELANIGVKQLDFLEPSIQHSLQCVVEVEREVQAIQPGIRYILTVLVDYVTPADSCVDVETASCSNTTACKVTILEKPRKTLPDGSKYRAVLANNCTKEWLFGDEGFILPQNNSNNKENNEINPSNTGHEGEHDDTIKVVHNIGVESQQNQQKSLTDDDIRQLEEQIIPKKDYMNTGQSASEYSETSAFTVSASDNLNKEHIDQSKAEKRKSNPILILEPTKLEPGYLTENRKKSIDDLFNLFGNFDNHFASPPSPKKEANIMIRKLCPSLINFVNY